MPIKKILVVEDDQNLNRLVEYNLTKNGYMVEKALDGTSAKEKLTRDFFDVVILDVMLPGIDGFRLCELIKKSAQARFTYVVMVTARTTPLDKICAETVGADRYITKPFAITQLMEVIKSVEAGTSPGV